MLCFYSFYKKPDLQKAARVCDELGGKERFITSLELDNDKNHSAFSSLVISDAMESGKKQDFYKNYKIKLSKRYLIVLLVLVLSNFITAFVSPYKNNIEISMGNSIESIKEDLNSVEKNKEVDKEILKEIKKAINIAQNELKKADTKKDGVNAVEKLQSELKKIEKKSLANDLSKMQEKISKTTLGESFPKHWKKGI